MKFILTIIAIFIIAGISSCAATNELITPAQEVEPQKTVEKVTVPKVDPVPEKNASLEDNGKVYVQEIKKVPSKQLKRISSKYEEQTAADVIKNAQKKASQKPTADRYINAITVYDYMEGALYEVISAPNHITNVMLQPGETLTSQPAGGDTVRWTVGVTTSKSGAEKTYHILVQPKLPGMNTNMVLTTDRHIYHLELKSHKETYQAAVSWRYPQDDLAKIVRIQDQEENREIAKINVSNLNFSYKVDGKADWKPVRVFDDGVKTYLKFPESIQQGELPPLFIVTKDNENQLVNYRYRNNYYIVDRIFKKALLQIGNKSSEKVYITRESKASESRWDDVR